MKDRYKRESERYFNSIASQYDRDGIYEMVKEDYPDILAELEKESCHDVLDCGCGTGAVLTLLHERHPDLALTGMDLTQKMIEVAQKRGLEGVTFLVADAENLPFDDNSFDVVICSHSFHHYPTPQRFFDGVARVLRAGGRLIIRDNTGSALWLFKENHYNIPRARLISHTGDVRFYSEREVSRFCERAGLALELFEERGWHKMHAVARKPRAEA